MSLLDKLLSARPRKKSSLRDSAENLVSSARTAENDREDVVLRLGTDQVRILLFRECEWRGRKLLFDSMMVQKYQSTNKTIWTTVNDNREENCKALFDIRTARDFERDKTIEDDVNLLSEMVFGTVAMTYRGSSFKVHSMNSPPCIMCTKIFPATEHGTCKRSERISDEGLGRSINMDSTSSNVSGAIFSRPSSGNLTGNDSHDGPRKNSTCSSIGGSWDIDVAPPMGGSSQSFASLESNASSGIGSLTSLRRRWLRAVSTSLGRSDSDDAFGMQHWSENGTDGRDGHAKRHKTRLGLTMLLRLTQGHESRQETRLLEHMALLEGMLDRIRYFCIEAADGSSSKGMQLADRLRSGTLRFVVSLLHILFNDNSDPSIRTPLLWHDVLLNSVTMRERANILHRGLQEMCRLFNELDTKSTNFFLSTVVTAVLTYHLGWVYTILSPHDRQVMAKLGSWYSCNPLWAQLGDLYGALGNPVKVAHTVIAGDSRKCDLINSVLSFLSYFIRSGAIRKCREYRCPSQEDVQQATNLLEQARSRRPYLFGNRKPAGIFNDRDTSIQRNLSSRKPTRPSDVVQRHPPATEERSRTTRTSRSISSAFKRSATVKSDLDALMTKSSEATLPAGLKFPSSENCVSEKYETIDQSTKDKEMNFTSSKVKIIVSEIESQKDIPPKGYKPDMPDMRYYSEKLDAQGVEDNLAIGKTERHRLQDNDVDPFKTYYNRPQLPLDSGDHGVVFDPMIPELKESQVFFTLGGEDNKSTKVRTRPRLGNNCQCSYTFTRAPSTSAQLPEGVLRKIIQRNFPESSKGIPPPGAASVMDARSIGFCLKCNGQGYATWQDYDGSNKQVLETPTNATEVLRTCGNSEGSRNVGLSRSNSLEALMEANSVVELPMPQSRKISAGNPGSTKRIGFTRTLLRNRIINDEDNYTCDAGYTWGLVLQGITKRKKRRKRKKISEIDKDNETELDEKWWSCMREEVIASARLPTIDQPVAEAVCVLADLDTWHVGILSNTAPYQSSPLPVGMSRLVSNMLECFAYVWQKYHSPTHCVAILEAKLRELWLRSEVLAEMMMSVEECDANVNNLTNALDLDAADIPLLLAVATTHSPEIAQRFGLILT